MEIDKNKDLIFLKQFRRYLTSQPFFIWNDLKIDFENTDLLESLENGENIDSFWEIFLDSENINNVSITANIQKKLENASHNYISQKYDEKDIFIIAEKDHEIACFVTQKALESQTYKLLINPVFKYKNAIAKISFYDIEEKKIGAIKFTSSTKLSDYIKAYFDFSIASKSIEIKNYSIFLLNYRDKYKKNEIDFFETFYANTTKTKRSSKKDISTIEKRKRYAGLLNEEKSIFDKISNGYIKENKNPEKEIFLADFDIYIKQINQFKNVEKRDEINEYDYTVWGENPFLTKLIETDLPEFSSFSGKIFTKKEIIEKNIISSKMFNLITENKIQNDYEKINNVISSLKISNKKIVWYDFESYSLPYPAIDDYYPYRQIPFQLSIIETKNHAIISKNNLVYDTLDYTNNNFIEIINTIYAKKAFRYVVYNKSYENTRLKEMMENLKISNNKYFNDSTKIKELEKRVNHIIENTIDLADLFIIKSRNGDVPPIFIPELKGYYSIKKIEKFITKHKINLKNTIKPYSDLEVQNGLMAMEWGIKRALGFVGDEEWKKEKENLKEYCENDVKAMLMVYDFAIYMQENPNIK